MLSCLDMKSGITSVLEEISTINAMGQTTVPKFVLQALGVANGGRIVFRMSNGGITVCRVDDEEYPLIGSFLSFLAADLKRHPKAVKELSPELAARISALTADIPDNADEAIEGEVAL